jgi:type III secretion protein J
MRTLTGAALICIVVFLVSGCRDVLLSRVSETQANEVVAALADAGIKAGKVAVDESTWRVEVESARFGEAAAALRDLGLPSQPRRTLSDVYKKDGLLSSPMEERARYSAALSEELSVALRKLEGVVDANVVVVIPKNDPLSDRVVPASASVLIRYRSEMSIHALVPSIKDYVAASVEGLDVKNVAVLTFSAPPRNGARPAEADELPGRTVTPQRLILLLGAMAAGCAAVWGVLWWRERSSHRSTQTGSLPVVAHGNVPSVSSSVARMLSSLQSARQWLKELKRRVGFHP